MAYTKHNWECGETITAELLNNLEGGVEEALECCGDKGYECVETQEIVYDKRIATTDRAWSVLELSTEITADSITVVFDGETYECENNYGGEGAGEYGAPYVDSSQNDFTIYPFYIYGSTVEGYIHTQVAGEHSLKIIVGSETVFDGTVTTQSETPVAEWIELLSQPIEAKETLTITWAGQTYTCPRQVYEAEGQTTYFYGASVDVTTGESDWSEYPFAISLNESRMIVVTEAPLTSTLQIASTSESVEVDDCFVKAVQKAYETFNTVTVELTTELNVPCPNNCPYTYRRETLQASAQELNEYFAMGKIVKTNSGGVVSKVTDLSYLVGTYTFTAQSATERPIFSTASIYCAECPQ